MKIHIEEEILGIKEWKAKVVSNYNVATYIKEFIVEIPEDMNYKGWIYSNQYPGNAGEIRRYGYYRTSSGSSR